MLRETLQNADDAKAKHVLIRFETESFCEGFLAGRNQAPDLSKNVCHVLLLAAALLTDDRYAGGPYRITELRSLHKIGIVSRLLVRFKIGASPEHGLTNCF